MRSSVVLPFRPLSNHVRVPSAAARRRAALGLPLAGALVTMIAACGERKPEIAAEPPPVPVVVAAVRVADVPIIAEFNGRLEAYESIEIVARVEGVLSESAIVQGTEVKKDQVLFRIDDRSYVASVKSAEASLAKSHADLRLAREQVQVRAAEAALAQANARLKRAQTDEARLRPLAEIDAVPRQDLDNAIASVEVAQAEVDAQEATLENTRLSTEIEIARAEAAVMSAEASLEQAQIQLGYCTIKAPADGWIGDLDIDPGNVVGRAGATKLTTLRNIDPIYVDFSISETSYLKYMDFAGGRRTPPPLELVLGDGRVWADTGTFLFAERFIDLTTGTITLRATFPNGQDLLLPGMFVRVRGETETLPAALVVPRRAVMQRQTARYVYIVGDDDRVQQRSVELGPDAGSDVVVTSGLAAGDRIIVEGLQKVTPGVSVAVKESATSSESEAPAADADGGA